MILSDTARKVCLARRCTDLPCWAVALEIELAPATNIKMSKNFAVSTHTREDYGDAEEFPRSRTM